MSCSQKKKQQTQIRSHKSPQPPTKRGSMQRCQYVPIKSLPSLRDPSTLHSVGQNADRAISEAVDRQDWYEGIRHLHRLEAHLSDEGIKISKKEYHTYSAVLANNKAYFLSELEKEQEAGNTMHQCMQHLQLVTAACRQGPQVVAYHTLTVRLGLKYCAILSHSGHHDEAIHQAQTLIDKVSQALLVLAQHSNKRMNGHLSTPQTVATCADSRERAAQRVDFKDIVLRQAHKLLAKMDELPSPKALVGSLRPHFEQKMKNMYFWKDSQDCIRNISKQLFQNVPKDNKRNLLGVQKSSSFVQQFSLSEVMSMDVLKFSSKINCDLYYLLSGPKLIELMLLASVCYFSMATETRFREGEVGKLKIVEKYHKLNQDQNMAASKIFHLKAIELAGKYLSPDNNYFIHLVNSFNNNYKSILDSIQEQSEITQPSHIVHKVQQQQVKQTPRESRGNKTQNGQNTTGTKMKKKQNAEEGKKYTHEKESKGNKGRKRSNSGFRRIASQTHLI